MGSQRSRRWRSVAAVSWTTVASTRLILALCPRLIACVWPRMDTFTGAAYGTSCASPPPLPRSVLLESLSHVSLATLTIHTPPHTRVARRQVECAVACIYTPGVTSTHTHITQARTRATHTAQRGMPDAGAPVLACVFIAWNVIEHGCNVILGGKHQELAGQDACRHCALVPQQLFQINASQACRG
jgi:hypothetical protein